MSVLVAQEEENDEVEPEVEVGGEYGEYGALETQPQISLNSVMGISNPKTIKMVGTVNGHEVVVMVDPGATHNFISLEAVKKLGVVMTASKSFGVSLGTGEAVRGEGECKGVRLVFPEVEIVEDFLPLTLGNSDIILGIQWLKKLGTMTTNWKTQTLVFQNHGETVTLRGDPSLGRSLISLKAMIRTLRKEGGGFLLEFNMLEEGSVQEDKEDSEPSFVWDSLAKYNQVFNMPHGLPPERGHEHTILLREGVEPVRVRPYRYPQRGRDREPGARYVEGRYYSTQ